MERARPDGKGNGSLERSSFRMYYPYDEELGVFRQHDTFAVRIFRPADTLDPNERPLNQRWSWDKILRSPFNQTVRCAADIYFLNDKYSIEEKRRNFDFYEPMTVHESHLYRLPFMLFWLRNSAGKTSRSGWYARTARLDLGQHNNDTDDGLHITSMSGAQLAIVKVSPACASRGNLAFQTIRSKNWQGYDFKINFRGSLLDREWSGE